MMPFPPRACEPGYLDVNPLGTVPLLIDGAARMTESSAICHYLAARDVHSLMAVQVDDAEYPNYLNYLDFGESTLTVPLAMILRYGRFEPEARRQPQVVVDHTRVFFARLRELESHLKDREYLCGARFTAADVSVGYALYLASFLELSTSFKPAVQSYFERLTQRDGFLRAKQAQIDAAVAQGVSTIPSPLSLPPG
jgi:glutathione S-transferase